MRLSAEQINRAITGFTDVVELNLQSDASTGKYELTLVLSDAEGKTVVLRCKDISNFGLSELGGGLTQFLSLRAEDVSARQLDRVSFHFADLERASIIFDCADATISD
jgi:hypothetical protein